MNYQDPSTLSPGTKVDQYVISGVLGRGGFGITYLVHDESLQKDFALKEFFPEDLVVREGTSIRFTAKPHSESDYRWGLKKFYDEARLLAQFSHSNIVSVRRVFEENNSAYMLLDFVRGSTLEKWLQGLDSPPTQEELDLIATPLLSALELVHANRTWHLDISPDNVMIRATDGAPILLDFGASRFEIKQHSQLVSALVFERATERQARLAVRPRRPFHLHRRGGRPMPLADRRRGRRPVRARPSAQPRDVRQGGRPLLCRRRIVRPVRRQHRLLGRGGGKE